MPTLYDAFISYSRKDSKAFAIQLHDQLDKQDFKTWLDLNGMPPAIEFQNQIDETIEKSHHFIFIISPASVASKYCRKEIDLAVKLNKRIIPILYLAHQDWDKMHPILNKLDQIFFRQDKLDNGEIHFDEQLAKLVEALNRDRKYVEQHTRILVDALKWQRHQKQGHYLLIGEDRVQAENWLTQKFDENLRPCEPTNLHCEYICESTINANNLMTQVFISYALEDKAFMLQTRQTLMRHHITVWMDKVDFQTQWNSQEETNEKIEQADNFIYLLSPNSRQSEICEQQLNHAISLNKRIFGLQIERFDKLNEPSLSLSKRENDSSLSLSKRKNDGSLSLSKRGLGKIFWQIIDFTQLDQLIRELHEDATYYEQHKILLVKALKWRQQNYNHSLLLRGYNLEHFKTWLKTAQQHKTHPPLPIQLEFVNESVHEFPEAVLDVFISYSQKDADLARKINDAFQAQGKTTWFDQESIPVGADFQQAIHHGIEICDNFLFIISPSAIHSPYCEEEVNYAQQLNKRIITILPFKIEATAVKDDLPTALKNIEWIDFNRYRGHFGTNFTELMRALEIDRDYVHAHTKWMLKAIEWNNQNQKAEWLLGETDLKAAQKWLQQAEQKQPAPTYLQTLFIKESQNALAQADIEKDHELETRVEQRTQKLIEQLANANFDYTQLKQRFWVAIGIGFVLVISFGLYGWEQKQLAQQVKTEAQQQAQLLQKTQQQAKDFEGLADQQRTQLEICQQDQEKLKICQQQLARLEKPIEEPESSTTTETVAENQESSITTETVDENQESSTTIETVDDNQESSTITEIVDDNPGESFRDILADGTKGPEMVWIPAGTFRMGDIQGGGISNEQPVHEVSIEPFAMGRYEVTFNEYDKFAEATGREKPHDQWGRGEHPVINVSWHDATAYTKWLSEQTGKPYRLPSEAEWEYAARAGTETSRYWGNNPDKACDYANVYDNTSKEKYGYPWTHHQCTDSYANTAPVGSFKPNAFGLFDMLGNVWEWTCSEYEKKYASKEQKCNLSENHADNRSLFVLRGGSWDINERWSRSAFRFWNEPTGRHNYLGVRLVRTF